jgi:hypothetical protein
MKNIITKKTSELWNTKEEEVFTVKKIYFYNGEHHVRAFNENREIDLPCVFFDDAGE